jgi:hypothetical protein
MRDSTNRARRGIRRLLRWIVGVLACASYLLCFACNSVFIPIPPPDPTFAEGSTPGEWSVSMPADSRASGALYYIFNENLGSGIIQRAETDGSMYASPWHGQVGDSIRIHWERSANESSSGICRPLGAGNVRVECQ